MGLVGNGCPRLKCGPVWTSRFLTLETAHSAAGDLTPDGSGWQAEAGVKQGVLGWNSAKKGLAQALAGPIKAWFFSLLACPGHSPKRTSGQGPSSQTRPAVSAPTCPSVRHLDARPRTRYLHAYMEKHPD